MVLFNNRPSVVYLVIKLYWCRVTTWTTTERNITPDNIESIVYYKKTGSKVRLAGCCFYFPFILYWIKARKLCIPIDHFRYIKIQLGSEA